MPTISQIVRTGRNRRRGGFGPQILFVGVETAQSSKYPEPSPANASSSSEATIQIPVSAQAEFDAQLSEIENLKLSTLGDQQRIEVLSSEIDKKLEKLKAVH